MADWDLSITERYETPINIVLILLAIVAFFSPWILGLLEINNEFFANLLFGILGILLGVYLNGMIYVYENHSLLAKLAASIVLFAAIIGPVLFLVFAGGSAIGEPIHSMYQQTYAISCLVAGVTVLVSHFGPFD
ncbi:hypothetical protein JZX76_16905 [Haloarcula hispanica]|uniref:Uncharacterized protein n=1 Tax=Haloarcula hispanica TaxID=51589 RepID=A0A482TAL1_HALHI|nr:hypothetical protein [Haloarcula hispanica]MCJ0621127.1 hypothetical protein [Haloarcula hispanica]RYJ08043.1 hypothetical protein ELS20_16765 [Haloarcula hispanica]